MKVASSIPAGRQLSDIHDQRPVPLAQLEHEALGDR